MRMDELAPLNDSKYKRDPAWAGSATLFYHIAGKNQPALGQDAGQTHFLFSVLAQERLYLGSGEN
ncbi:MAG: hypothetical protein ACLSHU_13280 [Oscillospiraceae bacterium]